MARCLLDSSFLPTATDSAGCPFVGLRFRQETNIRWGNNPPCAHPVQLCPRGGCGKLSVSTRLWKFWGKFNLAVGCEKLRGFTALLGWEIKVMGCNSPRRHIQSQLEQGRMGVSPQDCDPLECPFPPSQAEGCAL